MRSDGRDDDGHIAMTSSGSDFLTIETELGVCLIRLNRPEKLNAILPQMGLDYARALRRADADPQVRVIVVTGNGKGFCSGADLSILAEGPDALQGFVQGQSLDDLPTIARDLSVPVVMAVNGPAAGIGMVLALAGDVRFAGPDASFFSVFARLGLTAEYAVAWLLTRQVGLGRAQEILLSGRAVSADEALEIGLVHRIDQDPLAAAMAWAHDVATHCSPASLAAIKTQLSAAGNDDFATHLTHSLDMMSRSFTWPDLPEALLARLAGRPVQFPDAT